MPAMSGRSLHALAWMIVGVFLLFSVPFASAADSDLAGRFVESANKALAAGKLKEAEEYLDRAAAVAPQDERVRQARERVTAQKRAGEQARAEKQRVKDRAEEVARREKERTEEEARRKKQEPITGMEFVWVPKGCFQMGSPEHEPERLRNERRHKVCVEGFWIGKYEVTNGQYRKFRPGHNSSEDDKLPVTKVSWHDAMHFVQWLSDKAGQKLRLPTEAEWEYAARAGNSTPYFWGSWYEDKRDNFISLDVKPVGSHQPNAFGLYEMIGNVWEWTASIYDADYGGGELKAASLDTDAPRVSRGGYGAPRRTVMRSAFRDKDSPDYRKSNLGFRLARDP